MLDTEKIKEAESNMRKYLEDGLIKKALLDKQISDTYIKNSNESLEAAKLIADKKISNLWVIVNSYYAMYYAANAVLCKLGYKIGDKISHKITSDALIVLVRNKLKKYILETYEDIKKDALGLVQNKTDEIILNFDYERDKRSRFQYNMSETIKESKAKTSLIRAKDFVNEMKNLLDGI